MGVRMALHGEGAGDSARDIVAATLVVARVEPVQALATGRDKPVPYGPGPSRAGLADHRAGRGDCYGLRQAAKRREAMSDRPAGQESRRDTIVDAIAVVVVVLILVAMAVHFVAR